MRVKYLPLVIFTLLFFPAGLLWADCLDFSRSTSWGVEGGQKIIFYLGSVPLAVLNLQDCTVTPNSTVRLSKPYICDADTVIVDNEQCRLVALNSLE